MPSRGALEVKGLDEEVLDVAAGDQVARYVARYGQALVTNLRDFALVGADHAGDVRVLEVFRTSEGKTAFLEALKDPREVASRPLKLPGYRPREVRNVSQVRDRPAEGRNADAQERAEDLACRSGCVHSGPVASHSLASRAPSEPRGRGGIT